MFLVILILFLLDGNPTLSLSINILSIMSQVGNAMEILETSWRFTLVADISSLPQVPILTTPFVFQI